MLWCVMIMLLAITLGDTVCQRNGTAVHSLAAENLQEVENMIGSERQKQEEVVKVAVGSLYQGKALYS
jgi:hypothetical protein